MIDQFRPYTTFPLHCCKQQASNFNVREDRVLASVKEEGYPYRYKKA